jgi:transcription elongation factor GreA
VKHLKTVERPRIIKAIEEARSHGDLSENAEYHAAKEQQGWTEARVAELEDKLSRAEIIDISKLSGDTVKFGAKVTLIDEETDDETSYQIVGEFEETLQEPGLLVEAVIRQNGLRGSRQHPRAPGDRSADQKAASCQSERHAIISFPARGRPRPCACQNIYSSFYISASHMPVNCHVGVRTLPHVCDAPGGNASARRRSRRLQRRRRKSGRA